MSSTLALLTLFFYSVASIHLWIFTLLPSNQSLTSNSLLKNTLPFLLILAGLACHLYLAITTAYIQHSFNFSVASMALWVSALVTALFLVGTRIQPIKNLALLVIPISALSVLFSLVWGDQPTLIDQQSKLFYWHIFFSVSGFTFLSLCVLQSLLFAAQEYSLKHKRNLPLSRLLPPIQIMEKILFSLIWSGFILISLAISLGFFINHHESGKVIQFNHHNLLAILGWLTFAVLLTGRYLVGWRGAQTVKWTLLGFTFIQLGYFGTKLVQETLS